LGYISKILEIVKKVFNFSFSFFFQRKTKRIISNFYRRFNIFRFFFSKQGRSQKNIGEAALQFLKASIIDLAVKWKIRTKTWRRLHVVILLLMKK